MLPGAAVLEAGVGGAGVVWPLAGRLAGGGSVSSSSSLSVRVIISGSADFFLLLTSSTIGAVESALFFNSVPLVLLSPVTPVFTIPMHLELLRSVSFTSIKEMKECKYMATKSIF